MRTGRNIALALLAATLALPVFAGRGPGPREGRHAFHHGHHHHDGHGHHVRRRGWHRPHSRVSIWWGYPAQTRIPSYSFYDYAYSDWSARPNYAVNGTLLGALAGAVIGNNSGDLGNSSWRGAALGSVVGLAAGAVAEKRARERESAATAQAAPAKPDDVSTLQPTSEGERVKPAKTSSRLAEANRLFGR